MMAIGAALLNRTVTSKGQYIDASVHEACALTTEAAVTRYIYTGQIVRRQTGRHASPTPTDKSQHPCADGKYVNVAAQIVNRLTSERLQTLGDWMKDEGLAGDILDEKLRNPDSITDNELFLYFIANMDRGRRVPRRAEARLQYGRGAVAGGSSGGPASSGPGLLG